jgi:hypothetical protein
MTFKMTIAVFPYLSLVVLTLSFRQTTTKAILIRTHEQKDTSGNSKEDKEVVKQRGDFRVRVAGYPCFFLPPSLPPSLPSGPSILQSLSRHFDATQRGRVRRKCPEQCRSEAYEQTGQAGTAVIAVPTTLRHYGMSDMPRILVKSRRGRLPPRLDGIHW